MFSRIRGSERKSLTKEKLECKCVNVPINEIRDRDVKVVNIDCSSHPGLCVIDESGLCTKRENAAHCSMSPVELIGEIGATDNPTPEVRCSDACSGKRIHSYKIDLNNAEDTGLFADKQCQTCGNNCSALTCSSRSREFYISWDKKRSQILVFLIIAFGLWICIYISITALIPA